MLEEIKHNLEISRWSCKKIAQKSSVPEEFVACIKSGALEKETRGYKLNSETTKRHLKTLQEFFRPYTREQAKLEKRVSSSENETNLVLNKSSYRSESVLGGTEYVAQYNEIMQPVKMFIYDIEISPIEAWTYGKYKTNVLRIKKEQELMSFAYMWVEVDGEKSLIDGDVSETGCYTLADFNGSEEKLVNKLYEMIQDATVTQGWNSKKFDDRHINKYFAKYNLPPIKPKKHVDGLRMWKSHCVQVDNSLEGVASHLFGEMKTKIKVGDLWYDCLCGNSEEKEEAYKLLKKYNIQDVVLTYKIFKHILPLLEKAPLNMQTLMAHPLVCPRCGSLKGFEDAEYFYSDVGRYHQYQCKCCKAYSHGRYQDSTFEKDGKFIDIRPITK